MRFFLAFLGRRLGQGLLLAAAISLLVFSLLDLAPGDFLTNVRLNPQISPETYDSLRTAYGLDQRFPTRYLRWVRSLARGEWGYSFSFNAPVAPLIWGRAGNTLLLTITAASLTWLIAIPWGVWTASSRKRWPGRLLGACTSILVTLPDLALALGLLLVAVHTRRLPAGGMVSLDFNKLTPAAKVWDLVRHMLLPVASLILTALPLTLRHTYSSVREVMGAPFIQAARGHGIAESTVLFRYALPVAAKPLISLAGLSFAGLLSSSLLVEIVMSWPGLGPMLWQAILARDTYLVMGLVMASTLFLATGNILADVFLYLVDPRIRPEV